MVYYESNEIFNTMLDSICGIDDETKYYFYYLYRLESLKCFNMNTLSWVIKYIVFYNNVIFSSIHLIQAYEWLTMYIIGKS